MSPARILVIAASSDTSSDTSSGTSSGNGDAENLISRLLERLRGLPLSDRWWLTLLSDSELRIEHALRLQGKDLVIFLDSPPDQRGAFAFSRLRRHSGHRITAMNGPLSAEDLLHAFDTLSGSGSGSAGNASPGCYCLAIPGLSQQHRDAGGADHDPLQPALGFIEELLENPSAEFWDRRLDS